MRSVWIFRHIECEGPGYLEQVLSRHHLPYTLFAVDAQCRIPSDLEGAAALVFMGGPMSVNDNEDWIEHELALIRLGYQQNLPMLGHCLGAQLISKALGAKVYPNNHKEIGWLPVQRVQAVTGQRWLDSLPADFEVFHWHGETFSLPAGATHILKSELCINQAYVLGRILALQCHIEVTAAMVSQWTECYPEELDRPSNSIQTAAQMLDRLETHCDNLHRYAEVFYQYWLKNGGLIA